MEVGALTGAIELLVAKGMASEVGKDAADAVKQALGRLPGHT